MTAETVRPNPFEDATGKPSRVWGVALYSGSPRMAELACRIGFDTVWIEMEHGPTDFASAEALCYATLAHGGIPLIRLPDASRNFVLKAVEVGARILIVPMVNDAATAAQVVQHAKFTPVGSRGMNTSTPGTGFGLGGIRTVLEEVNDQVHLFAQIETREAVDNLDAICQVDGLTGVFVGPTDLSVDLGIPGEFENPQLLETIVDVISRARSAGKRPGILAPPGKLFDAAIEAGAQLIVVSSDVAALKIAWANLLKKCSEVPSP
jgi:2-keto-3-deoxy-L-rhamnonate aldolase RhmA